MLQSSFPTLADSAGHTRSARQVEKGEPDLTQFPLNPSLPYLIACTLTYFPESHQKGIVIYQKNIYMTILKRKGGDVKSKVKGLSGIWESKLNGSNLIYIIKA